MKKVDGGWEFSENEVRQIEYMYSRRWQETGEMGGVKLWFDILQRFLDREGYKITPKEKGESSSKGAK